MNAVRDGDCDICRGRRMVRLPVFRMVIYGGDPPLLPDESSRDFPCPQCTDTTPLERVRVLEGRTTVDARMANDPRAMMHVHQSLVHVLAGKVFEAGDVVFTLGELSRDGLRHAVHGRLAVVSAGYIAGLDVRIAQRQAEVASAVAAEAERQISNWGSYYGRESIRKDDAILFIREALKRIGATPAGNKPAVSQED